jgi:peptide/bleomycin uptake transporter
MFKSFFLTRYWAGWAWGGALLILTGTLGQVTIDVAINSWFGDFYNAIQGALGSPGSVSLSSYYLLLLGLGKYAGIYVLIAVLLSFFTKHWVFRWRQAMTEHYVTHWKSLHRIEGASQRVQEDTKRFATIVETLGVNIIESAFTLIAFLPILWGLSKHVHIVPIFGDLNHALVYGAILLALFGTVFLAAVGIHLPGLEFFNQRVEAAFRKEMVHAEDDVSRADLPVYRELFSAIRKNYFRLFFHYLYFDIAKYSYLQFTVVVPFILMGPTIIAGIITLGIMEQIIRAFTRVENSFQFLVRSWSSIIELISVYKRLRDFELQISRNQ